MTHFATYGGPLNIQDSSEDSVSVKVPLLRANEVTDKWPVLLWFYLKTLGLYHSGNQTGSKRQKQGNPAHFTGSHPDTFYGP